MSHACKTLLWTKSHLICYFAVDCAKLLFIRLLRCFFDKIEVKKRRKAILSVSEQGLDLQISTLLA